MIKNIVIGVVALLLLAVAWFAFALNWSYSSGERAGWVQKFSHKGWICKTWEGELALVSLPGTLGREASSPCTTMRSAHKLSAAMGKRVSLHYEEKVGLPTSCFGETRYFVTGIIETTEIPIGSGVVVPNAAGRFGREMRNTR